MYTCTYTCMFICLMPQRKNYTYMYTVHVATLLLNMRMALPSLIEPSGQSRMLPALRSLWIHPLEWMHSNASNIWWVMQRIWGSDKPWSNSADIIHMYTTGQGFKTHIHVHVYVITGDIGIYCIHVYMYVPPLPCFNNNYVHVHVQVSTCSNSKRCYIYKFKMFHPKPI